MRAAEALAILKEVQQAMFQSIAAYPKADAFLCICAKEAGFRSEPFEDLPAEWAGQRYRQLIQDLLVADCIPLTGAGFNHPGDELVRLNVSANERRRIWLAERIRELSA